MTQEPEALSQAKFEFEVGGLSRQVSIQSISGFKMNIPVADAEGAFGVGERGKVNRQAAPSEVESNDVTITFATSSDAPKAVSNWFYDSHAAPDRGGATKTKGRTEQATLTLFTQAGNPSATWVFSEVMPISYTLSGLNVRGNESLKETITFAYTYVERTA